MQPFQRIKFQRMDSDTIDRALGLGGPSPFGSVREMWNVHTGYGNEGKGNTPTNIKGMVEVAWPVPVGTNKVIGGIWDEATKAVYVFVYNSNNQHSILQFEPYNNNRITILIQSAILNFDPLHLITGADVINGEWLYWTDMFNQPRKLNIPQALARLAPSSTLRLAIPFEGVFRIRFSLAVVPRGQAQIPANQVAGSSTGDWLVSDYEGTLEGLLTQLNLWWATSGIQNYFTASVSGNSLTITPVGLGFEVFGFYTLFDSSYTGLGSFPLIFESVSDSYYITWADEMITWRKFPAMCQPSVELSSDNTRKYNFISRKVFQFSVAYRYKDGERSVISPYSKLIYDPLGGCDVSSTSGNNCIIIDFDSPELIDLGFLSILDSVEIFVREGNNGALKSVVVLKNAEFAYNRSYKFFNDGIYNVQDTPYASKFADSIPILAKSAEFIADSDNNNRGLLGGVIEGYDNYPLNTKIDLSFDQSVEVTGQGVDITGKIRIINPMYSAAVSPRGYFTSQPIHNLREQNTGGVPSSPNPGTVFGGFGVLDTENAVGSKYDQWLPEAGWPVYLAGTPYFDISEQNVFTNTYFNGRTIQPTLLANNVYDSSRLGAAILPWNTTHRAAIRQGIENAESQIYSEYNIRGVLPGRYILRIASHLCSYDDKLSKGAYYDLNDPDRKWHKTSTNLMSFDGGPVGGVNLYGTKEAVVVINDNLSWEVYVAGILVNSGLTGSVVIPDGNVADLTDPAVTSNTIVYSGYVYDNQAVADSTTTPLFQGTPVELARLYFRAINVGGTIFSLSTITALAKFYLDLIGGQWPGILDEFAFGKSATDHNGYFFWGLNTGALSLALQKIDVAVLQVTADTANPTGTYFAPTSTINFYQTLMGFSDAFYNGWVGGTLTFNSSPNDLPDTSRHHPVIFYNQNANAYDSCRTNVEGYVLDPAGVGIPGIGVVTTRGQTGRTDSTGYYRITVWGDTITNNNDRVDTLVFFSAGRCVFNFPNGNFLAYDVYEFNPAQRFSRQVPLVLGNLSASIISGQLIGRWKRGGTEQFGIIYKDDIGRSTAILTNEGMRKYIPFYTENLNDFNPSQFPVPNTFEYGNPILSWLIRNDVPIPEHGRFTHYQWFRTKNTLYNFWLQWSAKDIIYAEGWDEATTAPIASTYTNSNTREIYIDLENITEYRDIHSDSRVGYTYSNGDRLRLIMNENGLFYSDPSLGLNNPFIDVPITGQRGNYIIIEATGDVPELFAGIFFEVYTPKLQVEEKIYYELCGECYEIENPYSSTPTHSVTSGVFEAGDCYFRPRQIAIQGGVLNLSVEDQSISDFWPSLSENIGRIQIEDPDAEQLLRPTAIRVSNPYLQGSKQNGLSSFEGLNVREFDKGFGLINKLQVIGDVLLSICNNSRTVATYIGQAVIRDVQGQAVLALSDDILGNSRTLAMHAGTQNPESVIQQDNKAFWYDLAQGEMIQYDNNGLSAISDYQMKTFLAEQSKRYSYVPNAQFPAVFDKFFGEYQLVMPDATLRQGDESPSNTINGRMVAYFDAENYTASFRNILPEWLVGFNQSVISFVDGRLWLHNQDNVPRGMFYGTKYPARIKFVANQQPDAIKFWIALTEESTARWTATAENDRGQRTEMPAEVFEDFEGQWKGPFLMDINTPNTPVPLMNGQRMRSEALTVEISNNDDEEVSIFGVSVYFHNSERTDR